MIEPDDSLDQHALSREALSWVFRLRSGEMTEDEAAELMRWRALHPAHAQALSDAIKLRRRLVEAGQAITAEDTLPEAPPMPRRRAGRNRRSHRPSRRS